MLACLSPNGLSRYHTASAPTRLLVATTNGVASLARTARGAAWRVGETGLAGKHVCTLTTVPGHSGVLAGTHGEGIYMSADGGTDWEPRSTGVSRPDVYTLAAVERPGGVTIYAGTQPAALYRSDDLARTWRELPAIRQVPGTEHWTFPAPPRIAHTKMLAIHPRDPDTIYAAIEQGALLKTTDGGASWRELTDYSREDDRAYRDIHQILLVPSHPETMFLTTGVGLYRSEDAGETWERLTGADFRLAYPDHVMVSPDERTLFMSGAAADPGVWRRSHYAGTAVVRSDDGGRSWEIAHRGIPETARANIEAMTMASYPGGFSLFVGDTDGAVYCSEDGGETWSLIADALAPVSKGDHFMPLQAAAASGEARAAHP